MKAVISGAGIAGLAAAHDLAAIGWEVTLLERATGPRTQGYMIDFFGPGYDAAEHMGVLPRLMELGYRIDELRYHDDAGHARARLSYRRIAEALNGRVFSIMRPDLEGTLRAALPSGVRQLFGTSVRSVDDHGDGRVAVFAVHREADPTLPRAAGQAVRAAYATLGWVAPQVLSHVPPDAELYYDQVAQIVMPSWRRRRVVLVGDAAFAVSLLAGQGASLAIAGAFVLADRLHGTGSVEQGLDDYERIFRPVAEEKQRVAVKAARWFLPHTTTQLWVRRAALTLARIPVFTRYVAGAVTGKASGLLDAVARGADERQPGSLPSRTMFDGDH